jgi:hypothetical protein
VRRWLGKASEYSCTDCGQGAREWSYRGGSHREQTGEHNGYTITWSPLIDDYDPVCSRCHRVRDGGTFKLGNIPANKKLRE